ncbi:MAG: hypothetical protein HFF72_14565 [Oscillospiraceae bacterium]|jgi:hypothetical protein|nr:hypothetical protein [Oscillospiraceae bacterium]
MNYTENYHLPQWEETDRIMMEDFNQMCADIDSSIRQAQTKAETLPYVVGSYTGNGEADRDFHLGFQPRFLLICGNAQNTFSGNYCGQGIILVGTHVHSNLVYLTETGFQYKVKSSSFAFPAINEEGKPYDYIAFR